MLVCLHVCFNLSFDDNKRRYKCNKSVTPRENIIFSSCIATRFIIETKLLYQAYVTITELAF